MQLELQFNEEHASGESAKRLSRQCQAILDRLRQGAVSNTELTTIALRYSARIKELRAAGHRIDIVEADQLTGHRLYQLGGDR